MKRIIIAIAAALALSFAAMPAGACEKPECTDGTGQRYTQGFKHPNGQRCRCKAMYGTGEPRTGAPAYYDCQWR